MGAVSAMFAAVDGGARLWEASGVWKGSRPASFYRWRGALRVAGWAAVAAGLLLFFPVFLFACAILVGLAGFLLTLVGLDQARQRADDPLHVVAGGDVHAGVAADDRAQAGAARRADWRLAHSPPASWPIGLEGGCAAAGCAAAPMSCGAWSRARCRPRPRSRRLRRSCGRLIRGAAPLQQPRDTELGRRYVELISENLGQPGFRELLVVVSRPRGQARSRLRVPRRAAPGPVLRTDADDRPDPAWRRGLRPCRRGARTCDGRAVGVAGAARDHRAAPRHLRAGRSLARRDASPVRSARGAVARARGSRRRGRRAGRPAVGVAPGRAPARASGAARRSARQRR